MWCTPCIVTDPTTCEEIKQAFDTVYDNSTSCVKASHTIQLGCEQAYDCTASLFQFKLDDSCPESNKPFVSVTLKPASTCGAARPTLISTAYAYTLITVNSWRAALTVQSLVFDCSAATRGARGVLVAYAGKAVSFVKTDIISCSPTKSTVVEAYGVPLTFKGGAFRNGGRAGSFYYYDIHALDKITSTGTLLLVSGTQFVNNSAQHNILISKTTPLKLTASIKGAKFIDNVANANQACLIYSNRRDFTAADTPGEPLTLNLGGTISSGEEPRLFLGCVRALLCVGQCIYPYDSASPNY
jgi:hypothetical protein